MKNQPTLTAAEFKSAIYLDFEGRKSIADKKYPVPHMAGTFRPEPEGTCRKYQANFFKPEWAPAKNGGGGKVSNESFQDFFCLLLKELEAHNRHLVYWTMHEEAIMQRHLSVKLWRRLEPYLYNLHPLAKAYMNRRKAFGAGTTAKGRPLEEFLAAMYKKRNPYPPLATGPSMLCQRIDRACARTQRWNKFTDVQKKYVKDLLAYNEGDCRSTWLIAKRIGNAFTC